MNVGSWKVFTEFGWFKGNPPAGILIKVGEVVEDFPTGWLSITIIGIQVGKFCIDFGITK